MFEKQQERILEILQCEKPEDALKSLKTISIYRSYLKQNISLPCLLTGIEDFIWEEKYLMGFGDTGEYEEMKKTKPSYKDQFELLKIEDSPDDQILVSVRRVDDSKEFKLGLDWLKAVDEKSKNYDILDEYSIWFVNY